MAQLSDRPIEDTQRLCSTVPKLHETLSPIKGRNCLSGRKNRQCADVWQTCRHVGLIAGEYVWAGAVWFAD
ncbi:hypothetical protein PAMP_022230 [Pampus punctatissimus]